MAEVIGITGQIGSGKSVVIEGLRVLYGILCFDCDRVAKEAYFTPSVRESLLDTLSFDPIDGAGELKKKRISALLGSPQSKKVIEEIIHGAVERIFVKWKEAQRSRYVALESAILYTSGMYRHADHIVVVLANQNIRRQRVLHRDSWRDTDGFELIEALQEEEAKRQREEADIFIDNSGETSIIRELEKVYYQLEHHTT